MSAAATAAGYLYASGRLRGREKREEQEKAETPHEHKPKARIERPRIENPVRVAALPAAEDTRPRRVPTIQYRTRRWKPEQPHEE
jgi:hypothetical protein